MQALKSSDNPASDVTLSMLGFGPAPAYVSRSATQNRIAYLYRERNDNARPYSEVELAQKKRDAQTAYDAATRLPDPDKRLEAQQRALLHLQELHTKVRSKDYDVTMFQRLPPQDQLAVLEGATPQETLKYMPRVNHKLYANPDFWQIRKGAEEQIFGAGAR
jgi:hypothetical protein